jgi:hypothetical protein
MADRKISDLTALTTPASGDFLPIVDISEAAAASKNKKITYSDFLNNIPTGTITSTMILDGTILNADINASAAIVDTKLATIATGGKVSNSATTATDANTASAIVARDASGNFSAGTITAALTGAASSNVLKAGDTMTGALVVPLASAATPSLTFTGDLDSGVFSPGANQVAVATNGTGRLFVDASGNIKITTYQYQALSHKNFGYSGSYGALVVGAGGNNYGNISLGVDVSSISGGAFNGQNQVIFPATGGIIPNNAGTDYVGFYNRNSSDSLVLGPAVVGGITSGPLTLTSTSVGIGVSAPSYQLDLGGGTTVNTRIQIARGSDDSNAMRIGYNTIDLYRNVSLESAQTGLAINQVGSDGTRNVFQIDSSGRCGIGTTTVNNGVLHVKSNGIGSQAGLAVEASANDSFLSITNNGSAHKLEASYNSTGSYQPISFVINGEKARIDTSGRLLVGTSTAPTVSPASTAKLVVTNNTSSTAEGGILVLANGSTAASGFPPHKLGQILFTDSTGGEFGNIKCEFDGDAGLNDYPGRLVFSTTADGASSPTERMRIDSTGLMTLAGPGIKFPATQVASADANTLDDYEEGTWTPNQGPGLTVVGTFASSGSYTKIGRVVHVRVSVQSTTSVACSAGGQVCTNLPFEATNTYQPGSATNHTFNVSNGGMAFQYIVYNFESFLAAESLHYCITYTIS